MQNPYSPPTSDPGSPAGINQTADLSSLASGQRHVNYALLLYLSAVGLSLLLPKSSTGAAIFAVGVIGIGIYILVSVFRLAKVLHGTGFAIVYLLGMLIPLVDLLLLLILNRRATKKLKEAGYKVGLLGAKK